MIFCTSSHTGRLAAWLRSRYAGWKVGITRTPRYSNHFPRSRVTANPRPRSTSPATLPRVQITLGPIRSIWRWRNGRQAAISVSSGSRFRGGRHFTTLQMYTCSLEIPMAEMIRVSSRPASPTKGRPARSSSPPGPSPTRTSSARASPSPKTSRFLPS